MPDETNVLSEAGPASAPRACTSCEPRTLATLHRGVALAINSPLLYFVDSDSPDAGVDGGFDPYGPLLRIPTGGGVATRMTLAPMDPALSALLASGSYIYSVQYTVARLPILGGTAFIPIEGAPSYGPTLRANATHVFAMWTLSQQHMTRIGKEDGLVDEPATSPLNDWVDFAVDDSHLYVASQTTVTRVQLEGGDSAVVTALDPGETLISIELASDEELLLRSTTRLALVNKAGGTPRTLMTGTTVAASADGENAYYFQSTTGLDSCTAGSKLYAARLTDGTSWQLATDSQGCPARFVQDAASIFWLASDGGAIFAADKYPAD